MRIPDILIPDNPNFTVKGFTEIRDNTCNMINYSDWLKLNSVYEKSVKRLLVTRNSNFVFSLYHSKCEHPICICLNKRYKSELMKFQQHMCYDY